MNSDYSLFSFIPHLSLCDHIYYDNIHAMKLVSVTTFPSDISQIDYRSRF